MTAGTASGPHLSEELAMPIRIGDNYAPAFIKQGLTAEQQFIAGALPHSKVVLRYNQLGVNTEVRLRQLIPGHRLEFFVLTPDNTRVMYHMDLWKVRVWNRADLPPELVQRACYQASVWRSSPPVEHSLESYAKGLPKAMFWKYLVSHSRNVISDNAQSSMGEVFWGNRLVEAFQNGYHVYGLDCEAIKGELAITKAVRLHKVTERHKYYTDGQDMNGQYLRLCICKPR